MAVVVTMETYDTMFILNNNIYSNNTVAIADAITDIIDTAPSTVIVTNKTTSSVAKMIKSYESPSAVNLQSYTQMYKIIDNNTTTVCTTYDITMKIISYKVPSVNTKEALSTVSIADEATSSITMTTASYELNTDSIATPGDVIMKTYNMT